MFILSKGAKSLRIFLFIVIPSQTKVFILYGLWPHHKEACRRSNRELGISHSVITFEDLCFLQVTILFHVYWI